MIVIDLICPADHRFEGWFASSAAFAQQRDQGLVCCPTCASSAIRQLPCAPHVARASAAPPAAPSPQMRTARMLALLREQAAKSEDVGARFVEEVRRIHQGDAPDRPVKGTASVADAVALHEEGISVLPVPPEQDTQH